MPARDAVGQEGGVLGALDEAAGVDDARVEDDGVPGLRGHPLGAPGQEVAPEHERDGLPPGGGPAFDVDEARLVEGAPAAMRARHETEGEAALGVALQVEAHAREAVGLLRLVPVAALAEAAVHAVAVPVDGGEADVEVRVLEKAGLGAEHLAHDPEEAG